VFNRSLLPPNPGTLEEKRASLTALGAQLAGRGQALAQMEGQVAEQQRNLDRLTGGSGPWAGLSLRAPGETDCTTLAGLISRVPQ
jgi:hypothetical protein